MANTTNGAELKIAPKLYHDILNQPHALIAGQTGSGKSVFLRGLITTALKQGNNLFIVIDPKQVELNFMANLPTCLYYAETCEQVASVLDKAINIMNNRYSEMKSQNARTYQGNKILIFIDELADLLISEQANIIKKQLQKLLALGRAAKISVIMATQCPSRAILNANIILNVPCRIALKCTSQIESRQIIGVSGAENLPPFGYCLALLPPDNIKQYFVPMTSEQDERNTFVFCSELNKDYQKPSSRKAWAITTIPPKLKKWLKEILIFWAFVRICQMC